MVEMGHEKTYTDAIAKAGHKYMKDVAWKNKFKSRFHFLVVAILM